MSLSARFRRIGQGELSLDRRSRSGRGENMPILVAREASNESNGAPLRIAPSVLMKDSLQRDAEVRGDRQSELVLEQWERVKRARLNPSAFDDESENDESPEETLGEGNADSSPLVDNGTSMWRLFYKVDASNPSFRVCILRPKFSCAHTHQSTITNDLKSLCRHVRSGSHKDAKGHFDGLLKNGMAATQAATETILWAEEAWNRNSGKGVKKHATPFQTCEDRIMKEARAEAALFAFFVLSGTSFRQIESHSLSEMFNSFKWTEIPPSRARFSNTLLEECYGRVLEQRALLMRDVDFFSITMDGATPAHKKASRFVSVTVHFINRQWILDSHVLALISLPGDHSWDGLARAIAIRLENSVPVGSTLVATVTDQGANFVKAAYALHTNYTDLAVDGLGPDDWEEPPANAGEEETAIDPTVAHQCVAHRASNAALDAMESENARVLISIVNRPYGTPGQVWQGSEGCHKDVPCQGARHGPHGRGGAMIAQP